MGMLEVAAGNIRFDQLYRYGSANQTIWLIADVAGCLYGILAYASRN